MTDVIDALVGIAPGSALDEVRARRPLTRRHSQASHDALFAPASSGDVTADERFALGAYVAGLHRAPAITASFIAKLPAGLAKSVAAATGETLADGPHGSYPAGPLEAENTPPPPFRLSAGTAQALGPRLAAAFAHVHYLVYHPRDAAPDRFPPLKAAGWTEDGIVTLSQIVSFLAYQIRVVAGLRALAASR
jgi:CMD domain protein